MEFFKRSYRHWNLRYLVNRLKEIAYQKQHPEYPWLTPDAIKILNLWLRKTDVGLEFGSGRSTLYFAERIAHLTSVEHDPVWYRLITKKVQERKVSNINYLLFELGDDLKQEKVNSRYSQVANQFENASLDFVLVDGAYRGACANAVIDRIRPGGILVIDNVNWFLPSKTASPSSRTLDQGPVDKEWNDFFHRVKHWRWIWTSSGVTDTLILVKTC